MIGDHSELPDNIRQKFPRLRPIKSPPSLFTFNGIGLSLLGKRDLDQETGTYVKTHCICVVFIPLFALGAYRVADAGSRSWYFLGREPLSSFARWSNMVLGCLIMITGLAIGWNVHTSSPEYRAREELASAAESLSAGEPVRAAGIYRRQLQGPFRAEAWKGLQESVEAGLQSPESQTVAASLRLLASLPSGANVPDPVVSDGFERGLKLVSVFRTKDPEGALDILTATAALNPTNESIKPLNIELLKECIAAKPDNIDRVLELALIYESDDQLDQGVELLLPCREKLGDTEGARILGQHLLGEGNNEDAYGLLYPYVQTRLEKLRSIEKSYTNVIATVSSRALDTLKHGLAPDSFYSQYDNASETAKGQLVDEFIQARLRTDPAFLRVLDQLKAASSVVHVTLDLGIVQLNRAQKLKDAEARKKELEAAERTFLAIKGLAGETDEYRMFLGQVYYWLGRSAEGRVLFDELLASQNRAYRILISLSGTLRVVGEQVEARALAEEAYEKAGEPNDKFNAALLRSLLFKDTDDQIDWLEKADPADNDIQTELNSARGKKALTAGDKTLAADYLRKAISGYEKQARSAGSLNNCGLACFDLFEATGNAEDQKRGLALMEEAIQLDPGNSILIHNTIYFFLSRAVMDVVGDAIHTDVLGLQPGTFMLPHLYRTETERDAVYQQLRQSAHMKKALTYLDKVLLLAPKNIGNYSTALSVHSGFRDLAELRHLQERLHIAAPDLTEVREETLEHYRGGKEQENLEKYQVRIRDYEKLLSLPAVKSHAPTLEFATLKLLELRQSAWFFGGELDTKKMLQTALSVNRERESAASRSALQSAYFFRANEELSGQNRDYAALARRTRRALTPQHLIAFLLERGGSMAELVQKNENVIAGIALEKQTIDTFPGWPSTWQWALMRTPEPELAALLEKRLKENEAARLADKLTHEFNPLNATAVIDQYWQHKLMGEEQTGVALYQQALRDGVPLPPL